LVKLAEEANVEIKYNTTVETLNVESNNKIASLKVGVSYPFDIVASDIDIHALYKYLCQILLLKATSTRKSSSAYVFLEINKILQH
jgi:phytoene dehydrogenase-like protein